MTVEGKLERVFFGGEQWVLAAADGAQYQLVGTVAASLEGRRVRVSGEVLDGAGFSMVGPLLKISSLTPLG